jgi:hypothetical protein
MHRKSPDSRLAVRTRNIKCFTQQGMMLIMLVFVIGLAATAFLLNVLNSNTVKAGRDKKTAEALAEAKAALIGWSAKNANPGTLPCPEDVTAIGFPTEGQEVPSAGACPYTIGRLPWRTLGVGDLRDGYGERLWYVVSAGFHQSPINSNTAAQLTVDGVAASAVAIVFSAGPIVVGQARPTPTALAPPNITQYLDLSNNDGDTSFVSTGAANTFNDKLVRVKATDLYSVVTERVLGEIRGDTTQGMKKYYTDNAAYPYADFDGDGNADLGKLNGTPSFQGGPASLFFNTATKNMLLNNGWFALINYTVPAGQLSATLTLNGKIMSITP